jgi:hypothetical protein
MSVIVQKSQLVELLVSGTQLNQTRFNFPDQPQLRSEMAGRTVYIDGIECFNSNDVSVSPITGNTVISPAVMKTAALTLFIGDATAGSYKGEYINYMPLTSFHRIQSDTTSAFARDLLKFPSLGVDWSKSVVSIGAPIGGVDPKCFLFQIFYRYAEQISQPVPGLKK